ncbi:MAG: YdeI/OmpD-associated family protein [Deltaproteobacteria bacterium]|nr:YdeI/OmpD-associated family protein [Deltaproteobacteria bacterium]
MGGKRRALDAAERVEVANRAQWRAWLAGNHRRTSGIWLVVFKKHHPHYLPWADIVQEALCFGWIDSTNRRLDDDRTMLYLSPRKPGSPWSKINKRHIAELESSGLMQPAGRAKIDAAKRDGSWVLLDDVEAMIMPRDLEASFAEQPDARRNYDRFPDGAKRGLLWWIKSARTEATRQNRVAKTVAQAASGKIANRT